MSNFSSEYKSQARSGIDAELPPIDVFVNQFHTDFVHRITAPEFTSMCPKTGQPDFGTVIVTYNAARTCVELKSWKLYLHAYRNVGIFYENLVNKLTQDFCTACEPEWVIVECRMTPRGGISSSLYAVRGVPPLVVFPFRNS